MYKKFHELSLKKLFNTENGLDEKSLNYLVRALEKANLPGFDYLEFKQSLAALSSMNMDELTAFKSAFATASTVGLTKDKLLSSATHYEKVLEKEKLQFDQALRKQLKSRVEGKKQEVERRKKQIEDYREKIKQLQAEIDHSQAIINKGDELIQQELDKITATKQNFEYTFKNILEQLGKDVEKINTYL